MTAPPDRVRSTLLLGAYRLLSRFPGPLIARRLLARRARRGKEDPERLGERLGRPSAPRPEGRLCWLHAASVGESLSLLPLIDAILAARPDVSVLLTTGTRTAAAVVTPRLPARAIHQYAPVDVAPAVRRFLAHWRPDVFASVESEIWPTTLAEARRRGAHPLLLSARISARSAQGWARAPRSIAALLGQFDGILAQTDEIAERFIGLGASPARVCVGGALKDAAAPLPVAADAFAAWTRALAGRPVWLAASTHAGEETAAIAAHQALAPALPRLLTVIAPRHPERGDAVAAEITAAGVALARRTAGAPAPETAGVVLVDRLGELGLWYRLAPAAFVGGSLGGIGGIGGIGGHNPLEPARLATAILFGPDMDNFTSERARLLAADAALETDAARLPAQLRGLLSADGETTAAARALADAAGRVASEGGAATLRRHLAAVLNQLPPATQPPPAGMAAAAAGAAGA